MNIISIIHIKINVIISFTKTNTIVVIFAETPEHKKSNKLIHYYFSSQNFPFFNKYFFAVCYCLLVWPLHRIQPTLASTLVLHILNNCCLCYVVVGFM